MINELIVHMGDTKTGSTSIQNVLVQKAYDTPGVEIDYPAKTHHNGLVRSLLRKGQLNQVAARFGRIHDTFCDSSADYGIVSAEHFQFVDPVQFAEVVETHWPEMKHRMRLIAYVRPHHEKLLSSFCEKVKLGQVSGYFEVFCEEMSETKVLDYLPRFRKWRALFGDRFELRPFVREELFQGDVVRDFFRTMLEHEDFTTDDLNEVNKALTLPQLSLLRRTHDTLTERLRSRHITTAPRISDARAMLGRTVAERIQSLGLGQDGSRLLIPADLTRWIQQRYEADAAALDAEFFDGTPMTQALSKIEQKATTEAQSLQCDDHFAHEVGETVRSFAAILSDMLIDDPKQFQTMVARTRTVFADVR